MDFQGKTVLITGAGAGIGRATAVRLHDLGAQVFAISRSEGNLASLREERPTIQTFCQDIFDWNATRAIVENLPVIDYLVNNAGIGEQTPFLQVTESELDRVFGVNLKPIVNLSQVAAKKLIADGRPGAIVNVSSQASMRALADHTSYGASKAAMDQITRAMALELGPFGIRTNAINPTVTLTAMAEEHWSDPIKAKPMMDRIPLGKFAKPEDVVNGIVFLLSSNASMINGITMPVDGGFLVG